MILFVIAMILVVVLGINTARIDPGLNPEAAFFGRVFSPFCALLAFFMLISILIIGIMEIGDRVKKKSGYTFEGELRSLFTNRRGEERAVVELVNEGGNGDQMLHIFATSQIEKTDKYPFKSVNETL